MKKAHETLEFVEKQEESCYAGSPAADSSDKQAPRVLQALAATLDRLVLRNERCLSDLSSHRKLTVYHGLRPPNISILSYLERINKYSNCSPSCFVVGFVYIDQLVHKQPDVPLISLNVHRLIITSVMVATKLLDDVHYNNAFYARLGGIGKAELNSLELDLMFRLDFRLQVTTNMFEGYCTHLERELMLAEQRVDRALSKSNGNEHEGCHDRQGFLDDAQKKSKLVMNHEGAGKIVRTSMSPASNLLDP